MQIFIGSLFLSLSLPLMSTFLYLFFVIPSLAKIQNNGLLFSKYRTKSVFHRMVGNPWCIKLEQDHLNHTFPGHIWNIMLSQSYSASQVNFIRAEQPWVGWHQRHRPQHVCVTTNAKQRTCEKYQASDTRMRQCVFYQSGFWRRKNNKHLLCVTLYAPHCKSMRVHAHASLFLLARGCKCRHIIIFSYIVI